MTKTNGPWRIGIDHPASHSGASHTHRAGTEGNRALLGVRIQCGSGRRLPPHGETEDPQSGIPGFIEVSLSVGGCPGSH